MPDGAATGMQVRVDDIPNLDAAPAYETLRTEGSLRIIRLPSGHEAAHLVSYDDVLAVLNDTSFARAVCNKEDGPSFIPTTTPEDFLLNLDGGAHARSRRVINRTFGARLVAELEPLIESAVANAIDRMLAGHDGPDLYTSLLERIPFTAVASLLGVSEDEREAIRVQSHYVQIASPDDVPELLRQFDAIYSTVGTVVTRARGGDGTKFLAEFLQETDHAEPPLKDREITALLLAVMIGGDQNILSVMTKIVYVLLSAPSLYAQLVADETAIPSAIEELIRLIPLGTISIFPRVATRDFMSSHGVLPEGTVIYADAFRANRDPAAYGDPCAIKFERKGPRQLQFGYGMHNCMGAALARMEIGAVLRGLVRRMPRLRLNADPASLPWAVGTVLRRPEALPVAWS